MIDIDDVIHPDRDDSMEMFAEKLGHPKMDPTCLKLLRHEQWLYEDNYGGKATIMGMSVGFVGSMFAASTAVGVAAMLPVTLGAGFGAGKIGSTIGRSVFERRYGETIEQYANFTHDQCLNEDKLHKEQGRWAHLRTYSSAPNKAAEQNAAPGTSLERAKDKDISGTAFPAAASGAATPDTTPNPVNTVPAERKPQPGLEHHMASRLG